MLQTICLPKQVGQIYGKNLYLRSWKDHMMVAIEGDILILDFEGNTLQRIFFPQDIQTCSVWRDCFLFRGMGNVMMHVMELPNAKLKDEIGPLHGKESYAFPNLQTDDCSSKAVILDLDCIECFDLEKNKSCWISSEHNTILTLRF